MEDMIREGDIVPARLLEIIKRQLVSETDAGVITGLLRNLVPTIINKYIPRGSHWYKAHSEIFEIIVDEVLPSGVIKDDSTKHAVLEYAL